MNIALWVLQVVVALHTLVGAVWKLSNPETTVPSLAALPHGAWLGLGVVEVASALVLLLPARVKPLGRFVPIAAAFVVAEMLLFTVVHLASGAAEHSEVVYWLVVAGTCGVLTVGRAVVMPLRATFEPLP
ncbi:MAG: hypothetical protein RL199_1519 [Pseudomonadota bacterium]|jgi:xanthine/uracil/vitamin C permease (AzgA family)